MRVGVLANARNLSTPWPFVRLSSLSAFYWTHYEQARRSLQPPRSSGRGYAVINVRSDSRAQGVPCNDQSLKQTQFSVTVDTPCVRLSVALFSVRMRVDGGASWRA